MMDNQFEEFFRERFISMLESEKIKKAENYKTLNAHAQKGAVLFTGSSLMEQFPICEIAASAGISKTVYNRGIGGYTTDDFIRNIDTVLLDLQPSRVFINIGTNDMTDRVYGERWMEHLFENYETIIRTALDRIPGVEIFLMAYYPTCPHLPSLTDHDRELLKLRTKENIGECNRRVALLAEKYEQHYIDANAGLTDSNDETRQEFSVDGVHMYASAYEVIFNNLKKYIEA